MESVYKDTIAVLCAAPGSHYYEIPGLDVYDRDRDARSFIGSVPIIAHPPCAQWSRLRMFARVDPGTKALANWCYDRWLCNGGVFEHPVSSLVWKEFDWSAGRLYKVDLKDFGFGARKTTILAFRKCGPSSMPISFDAITHIVSGGSKGAKRARSRGLSIKWDANVTPLLFDQWLVDSIRESWLGV